MAFSSQDCLTRMDSVCEDSGKGVVEVACLCLVAFEVSPGNWTTWVWRIHLQDSFFTHRSGSRAGLVDQARLTGPGDLGSYKYVAFPCHSGFSRHVLGFIVSPLSFSGFQQPHSVL
jgi:hypothetical protein